MTLAGRKLRALLNRTQPPTSVEQFARDASLHRMTVHRVLNGQRWRHLDVNVCIAIMHAAQQYGLRLAIEDFAAVTAVPLEEADKEEPRRLPKAG